MKKIKILALFLIIGLIISLFVGCIELTTPQIKIGPGSMSNKGMPIDGEEKIVFASDRDGDYDIWMMNPDGTDQEKIIDTGGNDSCPRISPDGLKIAFNSDVSGNNDIYLMNVDSTNLVNLTNNASGDGRPAFSPDGTQIAFMSDRNGKYDIWLMSVSGGTASQVTDLPCIAGSPSFSPDGEKIVFKHRPSNPGNSYTNDLYEIDLTTNQITQLTFMGGSDDYPCFSHDGSQIVFTHCEENWKLNIYIMNSDGSNIRKLTETDSYSDKNSWFSPGDSQIVFRSARDGNCEIYTMDANGDFETNITNNSSDDNDPCWGFVSLEPVNTYTVTYNGNGNTGGTAPIDPLSPYESGAEVTVRKPSQSLVKKNYTFTGWNTTADGSGIAYSPLDTFTITSDVTLYVQWSTKVEKLTITDVLYSPDSGIAPLEVFFEASVTGGTKPYYYGWDFGDDNYKSGEGELYSDYYHDYIYPGEYNVTLSVFDLHGQSAQYKTKKSIIVNENPNPTPVTYRAIIVGTDYKNKFPADANEANNMFELLQHFKLGEDQITFDDYVILPGQDATRSNIITGIQCFQAPITDYNDVTYFYFAGHGGYWDQASHIAPYDAETEGTISEFELEDELDKIAGTKVVIIDACHSGGFIEGNEDNNVIIKTLKNFVESMIDRLATIEITRDASDISGSQYYVLAACQYWNWSYTHLSGDFLIFTRALREGCGYDGYPYPIPADADRDGKVSLREISKYINKIDWPQFFISPVPVYIWNRMTQSQAWPNNSNFTFFDY